MDKAQICNDLVACASDIPQNLLLLTWLKANPNMDK